MSFDRRLLEMHSQWPAAKIVLDRLREHRHRALLAGGCVRDALLGRPAKDLDIATSATPDQIAGLFEKTVDVGKAFGVLRVILLGTDLEVATFRGDGHYKDGRRPESVHFSDEQEDALRRDFTVNALFFDPETDQVIDFVGGVKDLEAKLLKTVGEPERRFAEDHLRLLRAVRFAGQLGFTIEARTWAVLKDRASEAASVSRERIRDELVKLLQAGAGGRGTRLLAESNLLKTLFPALDGFEGVLAASAERTLVRSIDDAGEALARWLAPLAKGGERGLRVAEEAWSALRLSKDEEKFVRKTLETLAEGEAFWARSLGRRLVDYADPAVKLAVELWDGENSAPRQAALKAEFNRIAPRNQLPPRLLTGEDLKSRVQGAKLGEALRASYEAQLEGRFHDRAAALTWVEAWLK